MKKSFNLLKTTFIAVFVLSMNILVSAQDYSVTVLTPSYPGIKWETGTTQWISWVDNFEYGVNIYLMDQAGTTTKSVIYEAAVGDTAGWLESTFPWTVTTTTDKYKIKVASYRKPNLYKDMSDSYFEVVHSLGDRMVLINPNWPGLKFERGSTQMISWTDNLPGGVWVYLMNGTTTVTTALGVKVEDPETTLEWTIPNNLPPSSDYRIKLVSDEIPDMSVTGVKFQVLATLYGKITLIQPNWYNIVWDKGIHMISWVDNIDTPVNILLLDGTGAFVQTITTTPIEHPESTYEWDFSGVIPGTYKIQVVSDTYTTVTTTGLPFKITDKYEKQIDIIQPNWTGIKWDRGNVHMISWIDNLENDPQNGAVSIYAINQTTSSVYTVTTSPQVHPISTYEWDIPADFEPGTYKIKIVSEAFSNTVSRTSMAFKIVDVLDPTLVIQQPDVAGIKWLANDVNEYYISWVDNLPYAIDVVLLRSDTKTGTYSFTKTITTVQPEDGTVYIWTPLISDADNDKWFRIQLICSGCYTTTTDISQYPFQLVKSLGGDITLIQPTYPYIAWMCGSTQWISWTDNVAEPLNIELLMKVGSNYESILDIAGFTSPVSAIPANESTYEWDIPTFGTGSITVEDFVYKIRVSSSANPSNIKDISDHPFKLYEPVDNISLYPNPCSEFTTLQFDNQSNANYIVTLYDRFGTQLRKINVDNSDSMQATIQTYDLPNGIYFINATSGEKVISKKIIVQH